MQILPLIPSVARYTFTTQLGDYELQFAVRWNERDAAWYFDIAAETGAPIVSGVKLVLGVALARRCLHPALTAGYLVAVDTSGQRRDAGFDDVGTPATRGRVQLRWIPAAEAVMTMMGLA